MMKMFGKKMDWITLISGAQELAESEAEESDVLETEADIEVRSEEWEMLEEKLTPLEAAGIATVLHITLQQLHILARAQIHMTNLSFITARKKLTTILEDTEIELKATLVYSTLFSHAQSRAANRKQTSILEDIAAKNAFQIQELQEKLKGIDRKKQKELRKRQEVIANLKDEIQELVTCSDINLRYAERWETARHGQCLIKSEAAEADLKQQLADIKKKFETEMRIHMEITTYLESSQKQLEEQISEWKEKYEQEMGRRKCKLHMLQAKRAEEQIKLRELTELYQEHKREINEYLEYKEKKRLEAEHDKYLYDMAAKIQAWWRGTMVRRGLGPYKRRKKLGKDKKKKK